MIFRQLYHSPTGYLDIRATTEAVISMSFCTEKPVAGFNPNPFLEDVIRQLDAYFSGDLYDFDIQLEPSGTPFQQKIWTLLREIPYGKTESYLALAERTGNRKSIRAVARANAANPIAILIPCHRVIGSDGSLTGYAGGLERKRWLLEHEKALVPDTQLNFF